MCLADPWDAREAGDRTELSLCTHLILSYDSLVPWDNETGRYEPTLYMNATELQQMYPHLKISLGIQQFDDYYFKLDQEKRTIFIQKAFDFLVQHKFDGLHMKYIFHCTYLACVNWHTAFLKELKEKLDEWQLLLTLTVLSSKESSPTTFD
ncbi:probable chitinase 2 isoform X2 [Contarinia nasturtii]|nr:probable chitinase 2 isoform X2 [Contarinia nasturtii]